MRPAKVRIICFVNLRPEWTHLPVAQQKNGHTEFHYANKWLMRSEHGKKRPCSWMKSIGLECFAFIACLPRLHLRRRRSRTNQLYGAANKNMRLIDCDNSSVANIIWHLINWHVNVCKQRTQFRCSPAAHISSGSLKCLYMRRRQMLIFFHSPPMRQTSFTPPSQYINEAFDLNTNTNTTSGQSNYA